MKTAYSITMLGLLLSVSGCATSSQVQEMIDASHRDYLAKSETHETSINILKQSSMVALEQNKEQASSLDAMQKQLEAALARLKIITRNAEAAKVMSAANTVKVAELNDAMLANKEAIGETSEKMTSTDKLHEETIIRFCQMIADSASTAITTLQADDVAVDNGEPAGLAEPIEIVAPDTSAPTGAVSGRAESPE
ncbi:MAG: hypothetical protein ABFR47_04875 [Verrucomicrobiota bacterium]